MCVILISRSGDYHRYAAEYSTGDEKDKAAGKSEAAYMNATGVAKEQLSTTHPIRLGLALNFSVFHYEIKNDPETACKTAKEVLCMCVMRDHKSNLLYSLLSFLGI